MPSSSRPTRIERAKPLLGTTVAIRALTQDADAPHLAVGRAFEAVARVQGLMSFHDPASELSRLNREAASAPVAVDAETLAVVREALRLAEASEGAFGPTVARALVAAGALPRPRDAPPPDPAANWRDVEIVGASVRFRRPLWLDLGGVAKGHAVDLACAALRAGGVTQGSVNAGGDLRVFGPEPEQVLLDPGWVDFEALPALELHDAAAAGSGRCDVSRGGRDGFSLHLDGATGETLPPGRFVSVVAERCIVADALTKVTLARGEAAEALFRVEDAVGYLFDAALGWRVLGADA